MPGGKRKRGDETVFTRMVPEESAVRTPSCAFCHRGMRELARVRCLECTNMVLCVDCFASGASVHPHSPSHPYLVEEPLTFALFCSDWPAEDELALLSGMLDSANSHSSSTAPYSWADVAEHIPTPRNKYDIALHYKHTYLQSPNAPLPDARFLIGKDESERQLAEQREKQEQEKKRLEDEGQREEREAAAQKLWSSGLPHDDKRLWNLHEEPPYFPKPNDPRLTAHSVEHTGFNAKRGDFDHEFDMEAESLLAELEFRSDDSSADREQKQRVLNIYSKRLNERLARKAFLLQRGQLNTKRLQWMERNRHLEEREACSRARVFSRFQTAEEHEYFSSGIVTERRVRQRIEQLQQMRMLGARTLDEGEDRDSNRRMPAAFLPTSAQTPGPPPPPEAGSAHAASGQQHGYTSQMPDQQPEPGSAVAESHSPALGKATNPQLQQNAGDQHSTPAQQPVEQTSAVSTLKSAVGTASQQSALRGLKEKTSLVVDPSVLPCADMLSDECVNTLLIVADLRISGLIRPKVTCLGCCAESLACVEVIEWCLHS